MNSYCAAKLCMTKDFVKYSCEGKKKATSFGASDERAGEIVKAGSEAL
jgi:hypothetical protein